MPRAINLPLNGSPMDGNTFPSILSLSLCHLGLLKDLHQRCWIVKQVFRKRIKVYLVSQLSGGWSVQLLGWGLCQCGVAEDLYLWSWEHSYICVHCCFCYSVTAPSASFGKMLWVLFSPLLCLGLGSEMTESVIKAELNNKFCKEIQLAFK